MFDDPIITEVRQVRDEIAARFNYDVSALGAYYQELESQLGLKTVTRAPKRVSEENGATEPADSIERSIAA